MATPYHHSCLLPDKKHWPGDCPLLVKQYDTVTIESNAVTHQSNGKHCRTCTCNRRIYPSAAAKQKAYRERKRVS